MPISSNTGGYLCLLIKVNKKYYYMRLNENYFDSETQVLLESMPDGYLYSNILMKLYLKSLKNDGKLMFNEKIPYSPQMIATITRHQIGTVEKALKIFRELNNALENDNNVFNIIETIILELYSEVSV